MKQNPKLPEQFAKIVIHELCAIRSTVDAISALMTKDLAIRNNKPQSYFGEKFKTIQDGKFKVSYAHYVKVLGLDEVV